MPPSPPEAPRAAGAPPRKRGALVRLGLAALLGGAGCGHAAFDGNVYRGDGFAFRVPPPPRGWERITVSHASLAFRDPTHEGTIAVSGRCKVDGEDVPLAALTRHLFLQFTEQEILRQDTLPFDGREAMHTVLGAKLDGVPMEFDVWVLKKDGCVYDLYYLAPPARFPEAATEFDQFVRGFATVPVHAAE